MNPREREKSKEKKNINRRPPREISFGKVFRIHLHKDNE